MDYSEINKEAAKLYGEELIENNSDKSKTPTNKYKKMFIILLTINIIIFIVVLVKALYVPGYEKPIKESIKLINKRTTDLNEYYKYMNPFQKFDQNSSYNPDCIETNTSEEYYEMDISILENVFGKNYKVSYDVVLLEEVDIEYFNSYYTIVLELTDLKLTKAYKMHILISTSGKELNDTFIYETHVLKVNDQWVLEYMITPEDIIGGIPVYGYTSH